jgi:peptidoglycan/xylan/chitin deacetylase (PgdA/CDA1 family)
VRRCAKGGVAFGPHTVTHPMLSQISESEAEWEISQSWKRLRAESDAAVPVFCYPSGVFSARDVNILRRNDLVAAVTTRPSYASRQLGNAAGSEARFHLPRFNYANDEAEFVSVVTGLDRVNSYLKQGRAGWHAVGAERAATAP